MSPRHTALLCACLAAALASPARAQDVQKVEKTAKLVKEDALLELKVKDFDFTFDKVQVKHQPDAKDFAKLEKKPTADWRPRISVDYANPGNIGLSLDMTVTLVDDAGKEIITCSDTATVAARTKSDYKLLCMSKAMPLADWPKITSARFSGAVKMAQPTLDKVFKFNDKRNIAEVKTKLGPVSVDRVVITGAPSDAEVKEANDSKPNANCHPRVMLLLSNPTDDKVKVEMRVLLEDKDGTAYLTCDRTDKLAAKKASDDLTLCMGVNMKVVDWPSVTHAHVVVTVKE
ncbi:MAG TPA: hypothetical protein VGK67_17590 [Myxococcales bacterium]|jgi:hypothetical protein